MIAPHNRTSKANTQYKIKKKPNAFSSDFLSFSARYLEIYLIIVLPNPKLNNDK